MASLNERNQQILGALSLVGGGANQLFGLRQTTTEKRAAEPFAQSTESVRAGIRKWGIEKPSLTYVGLTPPNLFASVVPDASALLSQLVTLRAERINQPGIQLMTSSLRRHGVGPLEKKPYSAAFNDVTVSFIGDARGIIHQFFYVWFSAIIGFDNMPQAGVPLDSFYGKPFELSYRDSYKTTIDIITYDEIQQKIGVVKLYNAYPISMGEIQRDWSGVNDLVRIPITFTYSHWAYDGNLELQLREPSRQTLASQNTSLFDNLMKGASVLQTITAVKSPRNINDVLNVVNTGSTLLRTLLPNRLNY
jgi:hypothetical protein